MTMRLKKTVINQPRFKLAVPGSRPRYGTPTKSGGLGALTSYPAVLHFQRLYNSVYEDSQEYPDPIRLTGGKIDEDGQYGKLETQPAMERIVNLWVRVGICTGTSSYDVRQNGPYAARSCLKTMVFTDAEIQELQRAWMEMKGLPAPGAGDGGDGDGGGGGGGDPTPDSEMPPLPEPKDAGVFGLVLFGLDMVLGFGLGRLIR